MSDQPDSLIIDNVKSFASGGVGGLAAVITGHPFDLVKVRLQTNQYKTAADCIKKTVANDGLLGFYRGVLPPIIGVTPIFAVSFWGYDMGKKLVARVTGTKAEAFTIAQISTAGFISAIPTTAITAPFERIKVVMQVEDSKHRTSMFQVVRKIYREGGLRSVFKGSLATLARDGPGSALYFATYEYLKKKLSKDSDTLSLGAITVAGGFAGVAMWTGIFPVDTIKSVQQSSNASVSITQVIKQIHQRQGIKGFFPGLGPALARSFPANAATFLGVELAREFLDSVL